MAKDPVLTLGEHVALWRTAQALSRSRLAQRVGVASSTVGRVESGAIGPSAHLWLALVDALAVGLCDAVRLWTEAESRGASLVSMADQLLDRDAPEAAHVVIQRAEQVDRDLYGGRYAGDFYRLQGRLAYAQGQFDAACQSFAAMDRHAHAHGGAPARARAGYDYGLALARLGRLEHALLSLTGAAEAARASGDPKLLAYSHWALGNLLSQIRDYPAAIAHYQEAGRVLTDPDHVAYVRWGELCARWENGEPDLLVPILAFLPHSPASLAAEIRSVVGALHRAAGQLSDARQWLEEAAAMADVGSTEWWTAQCELLTVYLLAGDEPFMRAVMEDLAAHGQPQERSYVDSLPSAWIASRRAPHLVTDLLSAPTTPCERTLDLVIHHRDPVVRGP